MANFKRLALFTSVSSTTISIYGYEDWRTKELRKLALYSEELSQWGYLKLPSGVSVADKTLSWENLLKPKMLKLWQEKHTGFDVEKGQWPEPQNGKNYQLTLRNGRVPGMPLVFSSNYLVQAILCYFVDPEMKLVHFGDQTSFKLKAIISPTWALASLVGLPTSKIPSKGGKEEGGGSFTSSSSFRWGGPPPDMFQFHGDDQSWHITNLPNRKHGKTGKALQWSSHFDAGVENIFTKGLPTGLAMAGCKADDDGDDVAGKKGEDIRKRVTKIETKSDAERAVLRVALHQLAIVFYSDTPGTLDRASGATGFYPGSHLVVLEGLKRLIHEQKIVSWWSLGYALRQVFGTGESLAEEELLRGGRSSGGSASKDWPLVQPSLESDQVLLALGALVHSSMFATELMQPGSNPRVIQNCKVAATFCSTQRKDVGQSEAVERVLAQEAFLDRISKTSPLYQTCVAPLGRAADMSMGSMDGGGREGGGKGEDTAQKTLSSAVMLFEEYRSHLKKEQSRSKK